MINSVIDQEQKLSTKILVAAPLGWGAVLLLLVAAMMVGVEMPIMTWPEQRWEQIFLGPFWMPGIASFSVISLIGAVYKDKIRLLGIAGFWMMVLPCLGYVAVAIVNLLTA